MLEYNERRIERFWTNVNKTDSCWIWMGTVSADGYGKVAFTQRDGKYTVRAHRFAYRVTKGDPSNYLVCHSCDNPLCVNPEHLFLGTNTDNQRDMIKKKRDNRANGSRLSDKLTEAQVLEIRDKFSKGISQRELARQYGIGHNAIYYIVHRKTWTHI